MEQWILSNSQRATYFRYNQSLCHSTVSLNERHSAYKVFEKRFGFLADMTTMKFSQLVLKSQNLVHHFPDEFDLNLANELTHPFNKTAR